jgi:hypothetical protein
LFYVYKALAYPEDTGYINPFTLEERLMHLEEAKRTLRMTVLWIVDNMENMLKGRLSKRFSNAEMIIHAQGKLASVSGVALGKSRNIDEMGGPCGEPHSNGGTEHQGSSTTQGGRQRCDP